MAEQLADRLAGWIGTRLPGPLVVGIDGPSDLVGPPAELAGPTAERTGGHRRPGVGADRGSGRGRAVPVGGRALADQLADRLVRSGTTVARASADWWWRAPSLRLEYGHTDVDSLLYGWLDAAAVNRELLTPATTTGSFLTRLRDPGSGRSVREPARPGPVQVVLFDGPFLAAAGLRFDATVHLSMSQAALGRRLPAENLWWTAGFLRYRAEFRPDELADVVIAYDHPQAPAVRWPL